jgi:hypothetical protein
VKPAEASKPEAKPAEAAKPEAKPAEAKPAAPEAKGKEAPPSKPDPKTAEAVPEKPQPKEGKPEEKAPEGKAPEAKTPDAKSPDEKTEKPPEKPVAQKGLFQIKDPAIKGEAWAYVPETYSAEVPHGLVLWFHGPEGFHEKELAALWKPLCDRYELILVAPKADDGKWRQRDTALVRPLLGHVAGAYKIDPARAVAAGREAGGSLAYLSALSYTNLFQAVASVDGPLAGRLPEQEPQAGLACFVARAEKSPRAAAIGETLERLRQWKYPITLKELGPDPRGLKPEELEELARWIDTLDRL